MLPVVMEEVATVESTRPQPLTACLDASLLLHILSFAVGKEALEHWRGQSKDCLLCPLSEGEAIHNITTTLVATRGDCRLVCKEWCQVLGGPFLRSIGLRSRGRGGIVHEKNKTESTSFTSNNNTTTTPHRQFGPWNSPKLFSGIRSATLAVTLAMLLDPLEAWHRELVTMAPSAGSGGDNGGAVGVRLNVERPGDTKEEVMALLALAATAAVQVDEEEDEGEEEGEEEEEEDETAAGVSGLDDEDEDEEEDEIAAGSLPPAMFLPLGLPAAGSLFAALPQENVIGHDAEEGDEDEGAEQAVQQHVDNGGIMGGLGGGVFYGHGAGNEAEEDSLDAITQVTRPSLPPPFALRPLPPPKAGFVLREICLSNLTTAREKINHENGLGAGVVTPHFHYHHHPLFEGTAAAAGGGKKKGGENAQGSSGNTLPSPPPVPLPYDEPFTLRDDMVHLLLRHMPATVERLSLARNPHLHRPLTPLSSQPIAPHLKEIVLDGCWRVDMYHLRAVEAVRGTGLSVDLLHECFGNGRGATGGSRPCGMKEVVILNGKFRGQWVKCWVIHKAGPSRYHCKVCATTEFDNAVGFSDRAALDISRKHLRHFCGRKVEGEEGRKGGKRG